MARINTTNIPSTTQAAFLPAPHPTDTTEATMTTRTPRPTDDASLLPHPLNICFLLVIALVLLAESTLTILINKTSEKVRGRTSTKLVTNLAVSGGLMGLSMGLYTVYRITTTADKRVVEEVSYILLKIVPFTLHMVSVLTLCCLTLDRYLAICWPLRYHDVVTPSRVRALTIASWAIPIPAFVPGITLSLMYRDTDVALITYVVLFVTATLAIVVMYCLLAKEFRGEATARMEMKDEDKRVRFRTTRDVLVIVTLNIFLSVPHMIAFVIQLAENRPNNDERQDYRGAFYLLITHQALFLPLYAWKNADFRGALLARCHAVLRGFRCGCGLLGNTKE